MSQVRDDLSKETWREKTRQVKTKGISVLFRLLFSRTMITALLILMQLFVWAMILCRVWMYPFLLGLSYVLSALAIVYLINSDMNPAFKLAWIIPICAVPVFGISFYLLVLCNPGNRDLKKLLDRRIDETKDLLRTNHRVLEKMEREEDDINNLSHYIEKENFFPTYDNTKVTFFSLGEQKYEQLLQDLEAAKDYIFLEYFIINEGEVWNRVLEILERKALSGVEVRVMYDGMCALTSLPFHYPEVLRQKGIQAKMFSPIRPLLSTHQNSRDHRKIVVIDGRIAYNGGINLADEYMNLKKRFGHWKDTAVRLEGEAVKSFVVMFLQLWNLTEKEAGMYDRYLTKNDWAERSEGLVIPYNDDPINRRDIAEEVYLNLIHTAKRYVHIMTPYLVIDNEMVTALTFAARRGVDVKIILPHVPDKKIIFAIARTYYPQLLDAGVQIYEYAPGFVHAKEFIVDDEKAVVGSINLDYRSLFQHFECATLIYKNPVICEMEQDYCETVERCIKIDMQYYVDLPFWYRFLGSVCRLIGPLV